MPYQPYQPTWNNPYAQQQFQPFQQQTVMPGAQQAYPQTGVQAYQQQGEVMKVDGEVEAMNRLLMKYANSLVSGFVSEPVFDINGRQFYVLSVDANSRRNLETFDYVPHSETTKVIINGVEFESREEFDSLSAKVRAVLGENDGVHEPVPATAAAKPQVKVVSPKTDDARRQRGGD